MFEEYTQALYQRYPDIRIEGENYLPLPVYRHIASFLSMFKLLLIGVIIVGKDPFALFGMQAPGLWVWSQENKASSHTFPVERFSFGGLDCSSSLKSVWVVCSKYKLFPHGAH